MSGRRVLASRAAVLLAVLLGSACSVDGAQPAPSATGPSPSSTASAPAATVGAAGGVEVSRTLATGLRVPWGVAFLPDGSALVAQRPTGRIVRIGSEGGTTAAGTVPGVADRGEGGLLGLAVLPAGTPVASPPGDATLAPAATGGLIEAISVFAYLTTNQDNRVVRMTYDGRTLSRPIPILTGIPAASFHNGGLVTFGPDHKLWIGTGEGGQPDRAQDRNNLGGKILRLNPDGSIPSDNPFPGSPVYSLGHRNVQGLTFDSVKQPWATEFGQNRWDELNRIVPGGNYGWPIVEGRSDRPGLVNPLVQWRPSEASPSGLAIVRDVAYIGALRGERLWRVPLNGTRTAHPKAFLEGQYGRIRTVAATPGGALWITTSNRDGRGSPRSGDDRVLLVRLT
jgi:glucose/arabinose dehydrogenase